jgi:hypothetical protein
MGVVLGKGCKAVGEDPADINEALGSQNVERNLETIEIMRVGGGIITEFPPGLSHPDLKDVGFSTGTEFSFIPDSASHFGGTTEGLVSCSSPADCFFVQPALENAARGNYVYSVVD